MKEHLARALERKLEKTSTVETQTTKMDFIKSGGHSGGGHSGGKDMYGRRRTQILQKEELDEDYKKEELGMSRNIGTCIATALLPLHCYHFTVSTTTTVSCIFNVVVVWLIVFASTTSITFRTFSFACTALPRTGNTEAQEKQEQKTQEKENSQNNYHHQIFWCHDRRDGASKIFGGLCGSRFWAGKFLTAAAATLFDRPLLLLTDLCFFLSSLLTSLRMSNSSTLSTAVIPLFETETTTLSW